MGCYGLTIPATKTCTFLVPPSPSPSSPTQTTQSKPDPFVQIKKRTRIPIGSVKTKALNDRVATTFAVSDLSFYELLGIPESGTFPEIKQAYKQLARKYHPDVSPPDRVEEYTKAFIRVQEAYETLSDPKRRAVYDRDMSGGLHLSFSARRRYQSRSYEGLDPKGEWRSRWQSQLSELKKRSTQKDEESMSWGARMRMQREQSSQ